MKALGIALTLALLIGCSSAMPNAPTPLKPEGFDPAFYSIFAGANFRKQHAKEVYISPVDDRGHQMDPLYLSKVQTEFEHLILAFTGTNDLKVKIGIGPPLFAVNIRWMTEVHPIACGQFIAVTNEIQLFYTTPLCKCGGEELLLTVPKHELGHALGFAIGQHSDSPQDLMYYMPTSCNTKPSEREILHARYAYQ